MSTDDEGYCENILDVAMVNTNTYPIDYYRGFAKSDMDSDELPLDTDHFSLVAQQE